MSEPLTHDDIDERVAPNIYVQDYSAKSSIEHVRIVHLKNSVGEDGNFSELLQLTPEGEVEHFPGLKLAQINRSRLLPQAVKAWHLHFRQNEIWYVAPSEHLFVGLWDVRRNSLTNGKTMRITLGGGNSTLLYIPRGVAHGAANFTQEAVELYYFVSEKFDINNPDERRISWDALGADFWSPQRD